MTVFSLWYLVGILVVIGFLIDDLECHGVNPQDDRATYVISNGTDYPTCFNAGRNNPCNTLGYVLKNSSKYCHKNCTVIVLSSQLNPRDGIDITLNRSQSLHVFGQGMISIDFNEILINLNGKSSVSFINIIFPSAFIRISGFHVIQLINTSFRNDTLLNFTQGTSLQIENATFASSPPTKLPLASVTFGLIDNINITRSLFMYKTLSLMIYNAGEVIIESCKFRHNNSSKPIIALQANNMTRILYTITSCQFVFNQVTSLIYFMSNALQGIFNIMNTTISSNTAVFDSSRNSLACLICIDAKAQCHIDITNSSILSNNGTVLNATDIAGCEYSIINSIIASNNAKTSIIHLISYLPWPFNNSVNLLNIDNSTIENNYAPFTTQDENAIVFMQCGLRVMRINNTRFTSNIGTPLALIECNVEVHGNISFDNNVAVFGGGVYFDKFASVSGNAKIQFVNNIAQYGTALYLGKNMDCLQTDDSKSTCEIEVKLSGISDQSSHIFSYSSWCQCNETYNKSFQTCWSISYDEEPLILSYPTSISVSEQKMNLFAGETIVLNFTVSDCNKTSTTCVANTFLRCGNERYCKFADNSIMLAGNVNPTLLLSTGIIDTRLVIELTREHKLIGSVSLFFQCESPPVGTYGASTNVTIRLVECPLGLEYNRSLKQCVCSITNHSDVYLCSPQHGHVCIRKGYWYKNIKMGKAFVTRCPYSSYCDFSKKACPSDLASDVSKFDYSHLSQNQDGQCRDGHGGTLCMNCAKNKSFTYLAVMCIDESQCKSWHPYMLLVMTITFPLLIGISLILVVQIQSDIGSGYLYGPLFFLAVLSQLPLGQYPTLDKIISVFAASVLLQFKAIGFIPWCFFPSMNPLYSAFLQFLNPIIMFVVLLTTVFIARRCPRIFLRLQRSPMQAMCILILVSYWSLIRTSILLLTPVYFNGNTVVLLQPDLQYLHKSHIPMWIISLLIMISLGVLVFLIILSQRLNFHRMKPLLDELQSCYHDKYRWYGVVYVCTWITIQGALYKYIVFQTVILAVTLAHCLVQPYKKKWLNMCDTCLLLDLLFLSALLSDQNQDIPQMKGKAIYLLVVIPLCFICVGAIGIITVRTGLFFLVKWLCKMLFSKYKEKFMVRQNSIQEPQNDYFTNEREPLIRILEEQ